MMNCPPSCLHFSQGDLVVLKVGAWTWWLNTSQITLVETQTIGVYILRYSHVWLVKAILYIYIYLYIYIIYILFLSLNQLFLVSWLCPAVLLISVGRMHPRIGWWAKNCRNPVFWGSTACSSCRRPLQAQSLESKCSLVKFPLKNGLCLLVHIFSWSGWVFFSDHFAFLEDTSREKDSL